MLYCYASSVKKIVSCISTNKDDNIHKSKSQQIIQIASFNYIEIVEMWLIFTRRIVGWNVKTKSCATKNISCYMDIGRCQVSCTFSSAKASYYQNSIIFQPLIVPPSFIIIINHHPIMIGHCVLNHGRFYPNENMWN